MITRAEKKQVESMTLEQIRVERRRAEGQILTILRGLRADTGLSVESVEVGTGQSSGWTYPDRQITVMSVSIKLEDI